MSRRFWNRDELIVAFNLYCKLRFGQCHRRNPRIVELARVLNRTPNAVAMKLCNFASFDPAHQDRGVSGLANVSQADGEIWGEFNEDWNRLVLESERAYQVLVREATPTEESEPSLDPRLAGLAPAQTETQRIQNVRLGQSFFRSTVLSCYADQCCMCRQSCKPLLIASHIVPWAIRPELRLNPRNGLCLCAMQDKAFDRGLVSVDSAFQIIISRRIEKFLPHAVIETMFIALVRAS